MNLKERIQRLAEEYLQDVIAIRRHLHQNPELSFEEFKTSEFIASELDKIGVEYERGMVKTGLVVLLQRKSSPSSSMSSSWG